MIILYAAITFACGSLMFSHLLARAFNIDLKTVGDGNPGGTNLWQTAGAKFGLAGIALDFFKGYLPLVILVSSGLVPTDSDGLILVGVAPILGHAFSPFLKFRGGKAIAVTFGVWSALTSFEASIAFAIILALLKVSEHFVKKSKKVGSPITDGIQTTVGLFILLIYLYFRHYSSALLLLGLCNLVIMAFTQIRGLYVSSRQKSSAQPPNNLMG